MKIKILAGDKKKNLAVFGDQNRANRDLIYYLQMVCCDLYVNVFFVDWLGDSGKSKAWHFKLRMIGCDKKCMACLYTNNKNKVEQKFKKCSYFICTYLCVNWKGVNQKKK